jgi:outer membrane protein OmpA-like peptidoglycan-associated protein/tetratricopeptide (TPR) repeat protein
MGREAFLILFVVQDFDPLTRQARPNNMNNTLFQIQKLQRIAVVKIIGRSSLLSMGCLAFVLSHAQQKKGPLQLADEYYSNGEYYTAALLYEQFLNPPKKQKSVSDFPLNIKGRRTAAPDKGLSRTGILYRQAECYQQANYWKQAASCYKQCLDKDPVEYADALYWYAVCQRSLGHYDSARQSLQQYMSSYGQRRYQAAAAKEVQTQAFIQQQLARPDSILFKTTKVDAPSSNTKGLFAPVHASGNQFLVTSTMEDPLPQEGTNPYHSHLFFATLNKGSVEEMNPVTISSSGSMMNEGAAAISANGNLLYFSQWKKENGKTVSSIYCAERQGAAWSSPKLVSLVNVKGFSSKQPFCSTDGKFLYFSSDRPGGVGGFDIWYAPMKDDGTLGDPINVGSAINTSGDEQAPFYQSSSSTLVFSSNGQLGMGGYDLFAATGSETSWKACVNMGSPINSSRDDIYFFTPEKQPLLAHSIFSSDRGDGCCLETYSVTKTPKSKRLTGSLHDCNDNTPLPNALVVLKDGTGKAWEASTNADGRFSFDLGNEDHDGLTIMMNKKLYVDTTSLVTLEKVDQSDLLIDQLAISDLCMRKKPEEPLIIHAEDVVTVYFDFDKSILKPVSITKLDSIYNVLAENPAATIQISGYTDGLGSNSYNNILSDKRARACANYLITKGIDTGRVSFVSFGKCCPVEMEIINGRDNPDGRSRNRRALINVKKE